MSIFTQDYRNTTIDLLIDDISASSNTAAANNLYYLCLSGHSPHPDDTNPPTETNNTGNYYYKVLSEMLMGKQLGSADVKKVVKRYNWSTGTKYRQYDDQDTTLYSNTNGFYVYTDDGNVYKCLANGYDGNSTVKPTGTANTSFYTEDGGATDGYKWKYMYTIPTSTNTDFVTSDFITVETDANVISTAVNGAIENVILTSNGGGYVAYLRDGIVNSVVNTTTLTITASIGSAILVDNSFNEAAIHFTSGDINGTVRTIQSFVANTRTITLNEPISGMTSNSQSSEFDIMPAVNIFGDGTGAVAVANVDSLSNTITNIKVLNVGQDYSYSNVSITAANGFFTVGAQARAIISPRKGHGSNAAEELGVEHFEIYKEFVGSDTNLDANNITFRTVSILKNPTTRGTTSAYTGSTFTQIHSVGLFRTDPGSTFEFSNNDFIKTASANGTVVFANSTVLKVANSFGSFLNGETISLFDSTTNTYSSSVYVINTNALATNTADLNTFSGEVLYYDNILPATRTNSSTENVRLIVKV